MPPVKTTRATRFALLFLQIYLFLLLGLLILRFTLLR
jgi:hypothetical protein